MGTLIKLLSLIAVSPLMAILGGCRSTYTGAVNALPIFKLNEDFGSVVSVKVIKVTDLYILALCQNAKIIIRGRVGGSLSDITEPLAVPVEVGKEYILYIRPNEVWSEAWSGPVFMRQYMDPIEPDASLSIFQAYNIVDNHVLPLTEESMAEIQYWWMRPTYREFINIFDQKP